MRREPGEGPREEQHAPPHQGQEGGSIYHPYSYEPKTFNIVLRRGKTATFESGPAANHNVISKQYIFNSDVGSKEGARVATSIGRFVDRCN